MSTIFSPTSTTSTASAPAPASFTSYFNALTRKRQQKKMSITQTYYLAHTARRKLTREASRADHDLRLLVGHANLLDSLMLDLADAEQEQERWFNQTVSGATKSAYRADQQHHIQWAETLVEEPEEDWDPEDLSETDSDLSEEDSDYEEDFAPLPVVRRRAPSPVAIITETELEDYDSDSDSEYEYEHDDAEDLDELALTRSPSRQPPELSHDEDDSEDDSMPPSPPQPILEAFDEKQAQADLALADSDFDHRYFVRAQQPMIEAC
ncbi:uncharacterized protein DSM5745_02330 [Aspergillus mulundensis]|uniref:Uncharacterized protein n=1 Tax=Aspergillus mulundensis TaxID=1810919 RepID=A0A3D8SW81_9EURO|nr:Uncharacterized protein DSM5745_02330 [Aspergillus mulundensis]RDW90555.1 Uncharacterized protein DSM5745_02330 [Aspergillus mulundensis]